MSTTSDRTYSVYASTYDAAMAAMTVHKLDRTHGMKPFRSWALLLFSLSTAILSGVASAQSTTKPVGLITLTVNGTGGTQSNAYTLAGLGLTQRALFQGASTSIGANLIVDTAAAWTDNQFNGVGNACCVEIISGANAGVILDIASTVASTQTITTVQPIPAGTVAGDSFVVRRHWTIGSVFGQTNQSGLAGGSVTSADQILLYNGSNPTNYYYQTVGLGGTGWRQAGAPTVDASGTVIYPDEGFFIERMQSAPLNIVLMGSVKTGQTSTPIMPGQNFVGNIYAAPMTLADCGLYTGSPATGLADGSSTSADQVLIWNPVLNGYDTYYYQTIGVGGTGWRKGGDRVDDASATPIPVGGAVIVNRKGATGFNWVIPQHPSTL